MVNTKFMSAICLCHALKVNSCTDAVSFCLTLSVV